MYVCEKMCRNTYHIECRQARAEALCDELSRMQSERWPSLLSINSTSSLLKELEILDLLKLDGSDPRVVVCCRRGEGRFDAILTGVGRVICDDDDSTTIAGNAEEAGSLRDDEGSAGSGACTLDGEIGGSGSGALGGGEAGPPYVCLPIREFLTTGVVLLPRHGVLVVVGVKERFGVAGDLGPSRRREANRAAKRSRKRFTSGRNGSEEREATLRSQPSVPRWALPPSFSPQPTTIAD